MLANRATFFSLLRYNLVQIAAYAVDYGIFWAFIALAPSQLVAANVASKLAAGIFAFLAHKYVTFRKPGRQSLYREIFAYFGLLAVNTVIATALLRALTMLFPPLIAKPIADIVYMPISFLMTKFLVFRDHGRQGGEAR